MNNAIYIISLFGGFSILMYSIGSYKSTYIYCLQEHSLFAGNYTLFNNYNINNREYDRYLFKRSR